MLVHYREIINNAPLSQIVKLQKKVVRMNGVPLMESITPHWNFLILLNWFFFFMIISTMKSFLIPVSLESELHNYNTCSESSNQVVIPSFRTYPSRDLRRSCPSVIGRFFWNSIPQLINHLKKCLGKHFYTGTLLNKNNETSSL